jgi:uncharacterized protein YndB with AHSA1/START domain
MWTQAFFLAAAMLQLHGQTSAGKVTTMQARKQSDLEIVLERKFPAPLLAVFDALTQAEDLVHWMNPSNMSLVSCEVDLREGGGFRYVFQRGRGSAIEVRGAYEKVSAPHSFSYIETYDFSPLKVIVATTLEQADGETLFKQTLKYPSRQERDEDFDGVATSAAELYGNLERYLGSHR